MNRFDAPWSKSLWIISLIVSALCLGMPFLPAKAPANLPFRWMIFLPPAMLMGAALFMIRGYVLTLDAILVERLLWNTRLPLANLRSADFQPKAMQGSIRTFGNGGLFSFSGYYRNSKLGAYRAFVTDLSRTVVLRYPEKVVVLSPNSPEEFVKQVSSLSSSVQAIR